MVVQDFRTQARGWGDCSCGVVPVLELLERRLLLSVGDLTYQDTLQDGVDGIDGLNAAVHLAISPDGANAYVAALNDDSVSVFQRNPATGQLTYQQVLKDGLNGVDGLYGAIAVTVSQDGANTYVAALYDNAVSVFRRDPATGQLTFQQALKYGLNGVDGLYGAKDVKVSPDGRTVYVAGYYDDAIVIFSRNPADGLLTYQTLLRDGTGGVDGLGGIRSIAVSPNGMDVYATGYTDNALALFSRDPATGLLTYRMAFRDGVSGVDGLAGAFCVTVSPDGRSVYVAGANDNAVAAFSRNEVSGLLTFRQVLKDGVAGIDGLALATSITASPDGNYVYSAAVNDSAVDVFARQASTSILTYERTIRDGVDGVNGLGGTQCVTLSPDGRNVYAVGSSDNALAIFDRETDRIHLQMAGGALMWTDADGTFVTASLRDGTADVTMTGFNLMPVASRGGITVTGIGVRPDFDLSGAASTASLSFTTKGGTIAGALVGNITGSVPVGKLSGATIDVGEIRMTGEGYIGSVKVRDILGSIVSMDGLGATRGLKVAVGRTNTADFYFASGLASFTAAQAGNGMFTAQWANSISIVGDRKRSLAGDCGLGIDLLGANAKGVALGKLIVAGAADSIHVGNSLGGIGTISLGSRANGSLAATTVQKITVNGDWIGQMVFSGRDARGFSLGNLTVKGTMTSSEIIAEGSIGDVIAGDMGSCLLFAGIVGPPRLPISPADFDTVAPAMIRSLTIKATWGSPGEPLFDDTVIAASTIGTVVLRDVSTTGGFYVPFGLTADTVIGKLTIYTGKTVTTSKSNITASLPDAGDFWVRIV